MQQIPRDWPYYAPDEIEAVAQVLRSGKVNYWTGEVCRQFEREFAAACQVRYAVAVSNGTTALELALRAAGIGPGDDVIVPSRTFVATADSVANCGARPVFSDVDKHSQNLTAHTIRQVLTEKTRAVIVVHLGGWPCEMDAINKLARDRNLLVVEDCAQAHGAKYKGRPVGSLGHVAAFSFCQDKIISTGGEGGMLVTDDAEIWRRAWSFKDHGKSYAAVYSKEKPAGFRWVHDSIGTNWRMTEMQAAIGSLQLAKLPLWHRRRSRNAGILYRLLRAQPALRMPMPPEHIEHAYYKYTVFLRPNRLQKAWSRDRILRELTAQGVPCLLGISPEIYQEKAFDGTGWRPPHRFRVARMLGETSLTFLVHPTLGDKDMENIAAVVSSVMQEATKPRALEVLYRMLNARAMAGRSRRRHVI